MAELLAQKAIWGEELTISATTFNGTFLPMSGRFVETPSIVIVQNDTNGAVILSQDGETNAITFVSGTHLVLDMQTNKGAADVFRFRKNELWYASGGVGTGSFKISYIYPV